MWVVVQTDNNKELKAKHFLLNNIKGVKEVFVTPLKEVSYTDRFGKKRIKTVPLLMGYVFANVKLDEGKGKDKLSPRNSKGEDMLIIRQLEKALSPNGYFRYKTKGNKDGVREPLLGTGINCHLLCHDPNNTPLGKMIEQARVPNSMMDAFKVFTLQEVGSADDLRVESDSYSDLIKVHDIVRVVKGPFAGKEGVVKRVTTKKDGKKIHDRRFVISLVDDLCISISGVHQNDIVIVHEARESENSKSVSLWRDIDAVIGSLQNNGHPDDAPKVLRQLIKEYINKDEEHIDDSLSDAVRLKLIKENDRKAADHKKEVISHVATDVHEQFKALGEYFSKKVGTTGRALKDYIPDSTIRPFLTPTAGTTIGKEGYIILQHKNFKEYIVRKDLSSCFRNAFKDNYVTTPNEDYVYYAHVAVGIYRGDKIAIVSWGGLFNKFSILSTLERKKFFEILKSRKYDKFYAILNQANEPKDKTSDKTATEVKGKPTIKFTRRFGIGGFTIKIDSDELKTVNYLIDFVAPVAVEIWQGTRLQEWRQLLQQYVLLHKVPIEDQPSVISGNKELDEVFNLKNSEGKPDIQSITDCLKIQESIISDSFSNGKYYDAVALFLQIAQHAGTAFVDYELYNYLDKKGYTPDAVCTRIYKSIIENIHNDHALKYLRRGIEELKSLDSWKYFHIPSFLKRQAIRHEQA